MTNLIRSTLTQGDLSRGSGSVWDIVKEGPHYYAIYRDGIQVAHSHSYQNAVTHINIVEAKENEREGRATEHGLGKGWFGQSKRHSDVKQNL